MPDLERYSRGWEMVDNVPAIGTDIERDRHGAAAGRLHQMRPDLGRLAAEIMQIGSSIAAGGDAWRRVRRDDIMPQNRRGEIP